MQIVIKNNSVDMKHLQFNIRETIGRSRFTARLEPISSTLLKIKTVRLVEKKPYCGNHPNGCEINTGRNNRNATWLEGLDWVSFNDLMNDVCDALYVDANVYTSVCWLRMGKLRRINYGSHSESFGFRDFNEWDKKGEPEDYADFCGLKAPDSTYPYGTPGAYDRTVDEEVESWRQIIEAGKSDLRKPRNFGSHNA